MEPRLQKSDIDRLVRAARSVRVRAYAPYSKFKVGAALLAADGRVFTGVNVENSAYPTSVCAERTAIGAAITAGVRRFTAIAIVTQPGATGEPGAPCGNCRQALSEFGLDLVVLLAGPRGAAEVVSLSELLPRAFTPKSLKEK